MTKALFRASSKQVALKNRLYYLKFWSQKQQPIPLSRTVQVPKHQQLFTRYNDDCLIIKGSKANTNTRLKKLYENIKNYMKMRRYNLNLLTTGKFRIRLEIKVFTVTCKSRI